MRLDLQAEQLNKAIGESGAGVLEMLAPRGRAIYFPKQGILAQSAEAKGKRINATIGTALEDDGRSMALHCVAGKVQLPVDQLVGYAPSFGLPELRAAWRDLLVAKNPSLAGKSCSLPVVTSALTHGLSVAGYLFCAPGDPVLLPDLYWENYELIFALTWDGRLETYPTFAGGGFNVAGLAERLRGYAAGRKVLVLLNFPNNPTGYTPTEEEARQLRDLLLQEAQRGLRLVVLIDDAYFGLVFEEGIRRESIFSLLCDLHPNLLAVKLDGPTKEDYVWGFRVGFITYGVKGAAPQFYAALEAKTAGAVRATISNCSMPAQSMLCAAFKDAAYAAEKREKYEILRRRYQEVRRILAAHPEYAEHFEALPFNSGYFMCLKMRKADPERLRRKLIENYSTGVIVMGGVVRLAFSATPQARLPELFDNIYRAAAELKD